MKTTDRPIRYATTDPLDSLLRAAHAAGAVVLYAPATRARATVPACEVAS